MRNYLIDKALTVEKQTAAVRTFFTRAWQHMNLAGHDVTTWTFTARHEHPSLARNPVVDDAIEHYLPLSLSFGDRLW
jgi:hypothetical protein